MGSWGKRIGSWLYSVYDRWWPVLLLVGPVLLLIYGPMALLFASLWVDSAWDYVRQAPFDAVTWRDRQLLDSQDSWRSRMVNDLLDEHDFTGWRRDDIVTLLGEPDDVSRVADYDMGYFLGPDSEPFVSERWLVFTLDGNGRVLDYQVLPIKF